MIIHLAFIIFSLHYINGHINSRSEQVNDLDKIAQHINLASNATATVISTQLHWRMDKDKWKRMKSKDK